MPFEDSKTYIYRNHVTGLREIANGMLYSNRYRVLVAPFYARILKDSRREIKDVSLTVETVIFVDCSLQFYAVNEIIVCEPNRLDILTFSNKQDMIDEAFDRALKMHYIVNL